MIITPYPGSKSMYRVLSRAKYRSENIINSGIAICGLLFCIRTIKRKS
jgi:hypothetical protein